MPSDVKLGEIEAGSALPAARQPASHHDLGFELSTDEVSFDGPGMGGIATPRARFEQVEDLTDGRVHHPTSSRRQWRGNADGTDDPATRRSLRFGAYRVRTQALPSMSRGPRDVVRRDVRGVVATVFGGPVHKYAVLEGGRPGETMRHPTGETAPSTAGAASGNCDIRAISGCYR